MVPTTTPPPLFGFGEIPDRYAPQPLPPLPWYYNQALTATVAIVTIAALIAVQIAYG